MKLRRLALLGISTNLDDAIPAISELFLKLQRTLADRPPPDMDPVLAEQHRTIQVLRALSDFVSRSCRNPALKNAIGRFLLDHALRIDHLSDGVRHLVLTEVTRPGRKPDTYDVWHARLYACAFLECLIQGRKCRREQAAKIVASELPILQRIMRDATEARITENRKPGKKRAAQAELEHAILSWPLQFQQGEVPKILHGAWGKILQSPTLPSCLEEWEERAEIFKKLAQERASAIILRGDKI
jgi:hypothetical protein